MAKQRTIVITGGGTGIGLAMAQRFCKAGDKVIIVGRRREVLDQAVERLSAYGSAFAVNADLSEPSGAKDLVESLKQQNITNIDVLINNAGGSRGLANASLEATAIQYLDNFTTNMLSAVLTTEALKSRIVRGGRIINLSSIAALKGGGSAYSAAKGAVISWSYALANELGPDKNITVNVIAPGYIPDTEFFGDTMTEERHSRLVNQTLLKRPGTPDDIAGAAFFLVSDDAAYITGQVIQVNGGALLR